VEFAEEENGEEKEATSVRIAACSCPALANLYKDVTP
jgi:hypothetical protein